jgi:hypothetical protein
MTATHSAQKITPKITREDIKSKLSEIQGDATETVENARMRLIGVAVAAGAVVVIAAFVIGRRGGRRKSTIIELKRA